MDLEKSGFKTTEFWLAVGTVAAGTLVLMGKLDTYNYPMASDIISKTLESICLIITQAAIIYKYLHMRHELKASHLELKKQQQENSDNSTTNTDLLQG